MSYEIRVSKSGKNALTSSSPNDFIFHSSYNTFKIISQATASFNVINSSSIQLYPVPHGQSYIPFVFAFAKMPDGIVVPAGGFSLDRNIIFAQLLVDDTNIYFGFVNNSGSDKIIYVSYFITEVPL